MSLIIRIVFGIEEEQQITEDVNGGVTYFGNGIHGNATQPPKDACHEESVVCHAALVEEIAHMPEHVANLEVYILLT